MIKRLLLWTGLALGCMAGAIGAQEATTLEYGVPVTGELTALQNSINYTFTGTAGDTIYLTLCPQAEDADLMMRLFDPNVTLLSEAIYIGDTWMIGPVTLPNDGAYTVQAGRPEWSESIGVFSLMVERAALSPLTLDTETTGRLAHPNEIAFFTFDAQAGDLIELMITGVALGFTIYTPGGAELIRDGYADELRMDITALPEGGEYRLMFRTTEPSGADYRLLARRIIPIPLTPGEASIGTIQSQEMAYFTFDSLGGKPWRIEATLSEGGDRQMRIYQLEGREAWDTNIAVDYGSGPNGNPRIAPFIPPVDGTYYVGLSFRNWDEETATQSDYTMTLYAETILSLAPGVEITATIPVNGGDLTYFYNGTAGETIRVTIARTSATGEPLLVVFTPIAEDVAVYFEGQQAHTGIFELTLPMDGTYRFVVGNEAYDEGNDLTFSLLLEAVGE